MSSVLQTAVYDSGTRQGGAHLWKTGLQAVPTGVTPHTHALPCELVTITLKQSTQKHTVFNIMKGHSPFD